MSNVTYVPYQDMDDESVWVADLLLDAVPLLADYMLEQPYTHYILLFAMHQPGGEGFTLLSVPDGPFLAVSPLDDAAETLLAATVPDLEAWRRCGAADWANKQRWQPVAAIYIKKIGRHSLTFYNPKEGR